MMRNYIGTKFVQAEPEMRTKLTCGNRTMYVPQGFKPSPEWISEHGFKTSDTFIHTDVDGYKVRYADGYESWSPKDVFDEAYRAVNENMDFGMALTCMKAGMRVTRAGTMLGNTPMTYVVYRQGYKDIQFNQDTLRAFRMAPGASGDVKPYLQGVYDDNVLFTYIPTIEDILATDWRVVFDDDLEMTAKFGEGSSNE